MAKLRTIRHEMGIFVGYFVPALAFILTTSWLVDDLREYVNGNQSILGPMKYGAIFLILCGSAVWLYKVGRERRMVHVLKRATLSEPHKALIALVSSQEAIFERQDDTLRVILGDNHVTLTGDLEQDNQAIAANFDGRWNWQQLLHVISRHRGELQKLLLVMSSGARGSSRQQEDCEKFLGLYLPGVEIAIASSQSGIDFDDTHAVYTTVTRCIDETVRQGIAAESILVDVTGGTKPASIGAAFATLQHTEVEFQYINSQRTPLSFNTTTISYENKMAG